MTWTAVKGPRSPLRRTPQTVQHDAEVARRQAKIDYALDRIFRDIARAFRERSC